MDENKTVLVISAIVNKENAAELQTYLGNVMQIFGKNNGKPIARFKSVESAPETVNSPDGLVVPIPMLPAVGSMKSRGLLSKRENTTFFVPFVPPSLNCQVLSGIFLVASATKNRSRAGPVLNFERQKKI